MNPSPVLLHVTVVIEDFKLAFQGLIKFLFEKTLTIKKFFRLSDWVKQPFDFEFFYLGWLADFKD